MDEEEKPPPKHWILGCDLYSFGVEELDDYAAALKAELERVETTKAGKQSYLGDAAKLFKS
ncbi:MAG: DUF1192 domain-containing protein [Kiloniellales bacterium]